MTGKKDQQKTVTIALTGDDLKVIKEYQGLVQQLFGIKLTEAKAARALLHQAAKAGAKEMLSAGGA